MSGKTYIQITDDRIHAPLRAALKAGDTVVLEYSYGHDRRYKRVVVVHTTTTKSVFIAGQKYVKGKGMVDAERRFSIKNGVEWGKNLPDYNRDRLFAATEDFADYADEHEQRRSEDLWRRKTMRKLQDWQYRGVSTETLRNILDLLEEDDGR